MATGKLRRLASPQTVSIGGADIALTPWDWLEQIEVRTGSHFTMVVVKDSRGRTFEVRNMDLGVWPKVFKIIRSVEGFKAGDVVDLLDPTTSDGASVEVVDPDDASKPVRVPVSALLPMRAPAGLSDQHTVFMLERDFGPFSVGDTVELHRSTMNSKGVMAFDPRFPSQTARVPTDLLTPVSGHPYQLATAV